MTNTYLSYIPKFMGLWRLLEPTIAKVRGYCVGGGSEPALCADLVISADDARFGTPYARVWGCQLTGLWGYRSGLAKAKYYALTGERVCSEGMTDRLSAAPVTIDRCDQGVVNSVPMTDSRYTT